MVEGLVACFTSVRPLAQAEDDTSHKKAKAPVISRSLRRGRRIHRKILKYPKSDKIICCQETAWCSVLLGALGTTPSALFHLHNCVKCTVFDLLSDSRMCWQAKLSKQNIN